MKKCNIALLLACTLLLTLFAACGGSGGESGGAASTPAAVSAAETAAVSEAVQASAETPAAPATADVSEASSDSPYGGEIVFATHNFVEIWDTYNTDYSLVYYYAEPLFIPDWSVDRSEYSFTTNFIPEEYFKGCLAESYEWLDDTTLYVRLRDNVYWQDKEPVNGRQFVASDVVYNFSRNMAINEFEGQEPSAYHAKRLTNVANVEAVDDLTVCFTFHKAAVTNIYLILDQAAYNYMLAPEVVEAGQASNWEYAVGTGPWVLTDVVAANSMTLERNPNYWGFDERNPENRLPYADTLKVLSVLDDSTLISYIRTGEVDFADQLTYSQIQILSGSSINAEISKVPIVATEGVQLNMTYEPFSDIRVRQALQMAIDRDTIATQYYGLESGTPAGWVNPSNADFAYGYDKWSDELKSEYAYDPERAKALLNEAGYPDLAFSVVVSADSDHTMLEIIKSYYAAVGVDMTIDAYDTATAVSLGAAKEYQATWTKNTASGANPWIMAAMDYTGAGTNYVLASDPDYDAIVDQISVAGTDQELKELCTALNKHVLENHWGIRLFPTYIYNVCSDRLSGYSGESLLRMGSPGGWFWARVSVGE